jgi:AcrR family transcriptional regulator
VILTAGELADRVGLDRLTLTAVAGELGVRTPSLYAHIDGLDALMTALRVYGIEQLGARITDAAIGRSRDEAIRGIATAFRAFAAEHPALYTVTVRAPVDDKDPSREASDAAVKAVLTVLAGYGLHGDEAIHATRYLRSTIHGFVSLEGAGGFGLPVELDASFDRVVDQVVRSLAQWDDKPAHLA